MRGSSPRMTRPPPSSFRRKPLIQLYRSKLDLRLSSGCRAVADARIKSAHDASPSFVIPAKAGIQLYRSKLDPDFRQGDERWQMRGSSGETMILEPLAQGELGDLAGRGVGYLIKEDDLIGQPPFGNPAAEMIEDLLSGQLGAGFPDDDQERPLVPFEMRQADGSSFGDTGAAYRNVLELDRGYPFAARFDDVLRSVGDLHI